MADARNNFAYSLVVTAPSPATSGTSLVVTAGQGALFPTPPFNCTIWPAHTLPISTNAEIVTITAISTDTFTIVRAQESTTAQTITAGFQIAETLTAKTITDLEGIYGTNTSLAYKSTLAVTIPTTSPRKVHAEYVDSYNAIKSLASYPYYLKLIQSITQFTSDNIPVVYNFRQGRVSGCELGDGSIVLAWYVGTPAIKFVIVNGSTYSVGSPVTVTTTPATAGSQFKVVPIPTTNNFCIVWCDTTVSNQGRFAIYDNTGAVVKAATTVQAAATYCGVSATSTGKLVMVFTGQQERSILFMIKLVH